MQRAADDFNPLAFGEEPQAPTAADNDVLKDFPDWWGAADAGLDSSSPMPLKSPLRLLNTHHQHATSSRHSVSCEVTHTSETETTSLHHRSSSVSWTSSSQPPQSNDLLSAVSIETDDASRSSVKRRRTATAGFQPLARVKENNVQGGQEEDIVRPWMVEIRDQDVVLGE